MEYLRKCLIALTLSNVPVLFCAIDDAAQNATAEQELLYMNDKTPYLASDKNRPLYYALANNNIEELKDAIKRGVDVNALDAPASHHPGLWLLPLQYSVRSCDDLERDETPVPRHVAEKEREEILQTLLTHNVNIDLQDTRGNTALMLAIEGNDDNLAELLLKYKANVNLRSDATPVTLAVEKDNIRLLQLLINEKALVNVRVASTGQTALGIAVAHKNKAIATMLVLEGAECYALQKPFAERNRPSERNDVLWNIADPEMQEVMSAAQKKEESAYTLVQEALAAAEKTRQEKEAQSAE